MVIYFDQIDSTNRIAKELLIKGKPSGTVVHAGMQSAGKGQYGRTFNSPPGGLYFSLLLKPNLDQAHLPLVTLATGLACRDVLHSSFSIQPQIKWPNDIYLNDKKLAGILCENLGTHAGKDTCANVVIGVGLNINNTTEDFPIEVQPIITTLFDHVKIQVDLPSLLSLLVTAIIKNVTILSEDQQIILEQWQQYDYLYKKSIVYTAGALTIQGIGLGLLSQGHYRLQDTQGNEHCIVGGQLRLNHAAT
jgi:BirA family transcriptional regulator, biotin operon repressor / biotin---[acetyl-CoA-carboxylase] ligase